MEATRYLAGVAAGALFPAVLACAHGPPAPEEDEERAERREVQVLQQRVLHLERRISDLDAQLSLLTDKLDGKGRGNRPLARIPLRMPPREQPPSVSSDDPPSPKDAVSEAPEEGRIGFGSRTVDIERSAAPETSAAAASEEPLVTSEEAAEGRDGPPLVIDAAALARLSNNKGGAVARDTDDAPLSSRLPAGGVDPLYQWARAKMEDEDFDAAVTGFAAVLERHPEHHLADNALYWTAVCHHRAGALAAAIRSYKSLPMRFPGSAKMPDALFGMAQVYEAQGETDLARALYIQLIDQYPRAERAPEARRAVSRLHAR